MSVAWKHTLASISHLSHRLSVDVYEAPLVGRQTMPRTHARHRYCITYIKEMNCKGINNCAIRYYPPLLQHARLQEWQRPSPLCIDTVFCFVVLNLLFLNVLLGTQLWSTLSPSPVGQQNGTMLVVNIVLALHGTNLSNISMAFL